MSNQLQRIEPGAVAVQPSDTASATLELLSRAVSDPSVDPARLEKFMDLHERILRDQRAREFAAAMQAAQSEMPRVYRDAKNSQTNSRYARLESIHMAATPIYTRHGFSLSFGTADSPHPDCVRVTCCVRHRAGHTEHHHADVPLDVLGPKGTANKTKTHGFGSSLSYGRRYLTLLIFNIATNDDDDGNGGKKQQPEGPDPAQALRKELWALLKGVRGSEGNWKIANQWCWDECGLDLDKRIESMEAEGLRWLVKRAKERMTELDAHTKSVMGGQQ